MTLLHKFIVFPAIYLVTGQDNNIKGKREEEEDTVIKFLEEEFLKCQQLLEAQPGFSGDNVPMSSDPSGGSSCSDRRPLRLGFYQAAVTDRPEMKVRTLRYLNRSAVIVSV